MSEKLLKDLHWRINDIKETLVSSDYYCLDEWSTPILNLNTALKIIDKELENIDTLERKRTE
jgi:hypothetical protein